MISFPGNAEFPSKRSSAPFKKALLLSEFKRLEIADLPDPAPGRDEVLVSVAARGICGSDVHGYDGSSGRRIPPIVMGHEAAGTIAALGDGVTGFAVGDRVTFDSTIFCGACNNCRRGDVNLCDYRQVLGVSRSEYCRGGSLAEYVSVPSRILYRLPHTLAFDEAAMLEAVSVALHGVALELVRIKRARAPAPFLQAEKYKPRCS